jgi:hypothetical protein
LEIGKDGLAKSLIAIHSPKTLYAFINHPLFAIRPLWHGRQSRVARAARGAIPETGESASLLVRESGSQAPAWLAKRSPAILHYQFLSESISGSIQTISLSVLISDISGKNSGESKHVPCSATGEGLDSRPSTPLLHQWLRARDYENSLNLPSPTINYET